MTDKHAIRLYNPVIPQLEGMTEEEKNRALMEYMRDSARQINTMAAQIEELIKDGVYKEQD